MGEGERARGENKKAGWLKSVIDGARFMTLTGHWIYCAWVEMQYAVGERADVRVYACAVA
jgi:hypothetical protein